MDGGSENTARAVFMTIEHLVSRCFCPLIVLSRLPVGHTHEDIDSRFGKIWVSAFFDSHLVSRSLLLITSRCVWLFPASSSLVQTFIRQKSIYTPKDFANACRQALGNGSNIRVEFIVCHYNYKEYYDQFLDKRIHILVGGAAQLQYKFELATPEDLANFPGHFPLGVKVNYRKCAQQRTTKMLPCSCPPHSVQVYKVHLMTSTWLPAESPFDELNVPGISFFTQPPVGFPSIQSFRSGWHAEFVSFLSAVNLRFFSQDKYTPVRVDWASFAANTMPRSDNVLDYLHLNEVPLHLSKGLWKVGGSFRSPEEGQAALSSLDTIHDAFSDAYETRRSPLDLRVEETLRQEIPVIPNRHYTDIPRRVIWRHPYRGLLISVAFVERAAASSSSSQQQQQQPQQVAAVAGVVAAAEVVEAAVAAAVVAPQPQPQPPQPQPQPPVMVAPQPQPQQQPPPLLLPNIVGAPQQPQPPVVAQPQPQPQPQQLQLPVIVPPQQQNPPQQPPPASTGITYKIGEITTFTPATPEAPASYRVIFQGPGDDFDQDVDVSQMEVARDRYVYSLNFY